ncbi:transcriptional regulator [Roseivirga sp. 4D4]|uniref:helix-turn-helix domain-containing protein n=1 Tax=Roseivirga sp. 4D4 TaxID=1889784 RepID=UPI00085382E2|nr:helix-turn-helix transcriptional regulator [Roseivirga sp. 4D4]OEK03285.1 transcriptional regulator [Roseivirga sp. 4D4]
MKEDQLYKDKLDQLGQRIRSLRIAKGYTNAEKFAYEHDISRSQYAQYEKGKDLRYTSLLKLLSAFDISIQEFFAQGFD